MNSKRLGKFENTVNILSLGKGRPGELNFNRVIIFDSTMEHAQTAASVLGVVNFAKSANCVNPHRVLMMAFVCNSTQTISSASALSHSRASCVTWAVVKLYRV